MESNAGSNADDLLAKLEEEGIDHLDMREVFPAEELESLSIFYKTDHHWRIPAGLFAAQVLAQYINDHYHLGLDPSVIADEKMQTEFLPDSWVGEIGRRTSAAFSGMDDFELITPIDPGSFHVTSPDRGFDQTGGFSVMLNEQNLNITNLQDLYKKSFYYVYLYNNAPLLIIDNLEERSGRILIIKDSFAQAMNPFLAMTADKLISWDVRYNRQDLKEYLKEEPVDLVMVMYTESMINESMFAFYTKADQ